MVKLFTIIGLFISLMMSGFYSLSAKETYVQPTANQHLQPAIPWAKELPPSFSRTMSEPAPRTESQPLTPVSPKPIRIRPVQPTLTLPKSNPENFKINRKKEVKTKLRTKDDKPRRKMSGVAVVGFVFGILGFLTCWIPILGFILSLVGVICSSIGMGQVNREPDMRGRTLAVIGLVFSIIGLVIGVISTIIGIVALAVVA